MGGDGGHGSWGGGDGWNMTLFANPPRRGGLPVEVGAFLGNVLRQTYATLETRGMWAACATPLSDPWMQLTHRTPRGLGLGWFSYVHFTW